MEYLQRDPIIEAYFNFRHTNEDNVVFSETVLRLALKHVLQFKNQREEKLLSMYRKLITIILHTHYGKTLEELEKIMICYKSNDIMTILDEMDVIEDIWKVFTVDDIMYFIRKQAFFIILYEWTRRFVHLYGREALNDETIGDMTLRLHDHFNWPVKSVHQWKRSFESKFLKGNSREFDDHDLHDIEEEDLTINKITDDLGEKIHPLIHEENLQKFTQSIKSKDFEAEHKSKIFKQQQQQQRPVMTTTPIYKKSVMEVVQQQQQQQQKPISNKIPVNEVKLVQIVGEIKNDVEQEFVVDYYDDEDCEEVEEAEEEEDVAIEEDEDEEEEDDDDDDDDEEDAYDVAAPLAKKPKTTTQGESEIVACREPKASDQDNVDSHKTETSIQPATPDNENESATNLLSHEQAIQSISALQAYAVVNGFFDAIILLDQVDSIFRVKKGASK